jgi:hypothetical protein
MKIAFLPCILVILFAAPLLYSGEVIVIRVVDEMALARLEPDPGSQVLRQFPMGALLEAKSRIGDWYEISFTDDSGYTIVAYIQSGSVEVIRKDVAPPPEIQEEAIPMDTPPDADQKGRILSGFFLKLGVMNKEGGGWIGSLGYDFRLHKNITLGLEVMPSYTSFKDATVELDMKTVSAFTLANIKAGTSLNFIKMDFFKVYAGLGGGMALNFTRTTFEGYSSTLFKYNPALQILGGFEFDIGKVSLIFEYQKLRDLNPDVDPDEWVGYLIFGIRF